MDELKASCLNLGPNDIIAKISLNAFGRSVIAINRLQKITQIAENRFNEVNVLKVVT